MKPKTVFYCTECGNEFPKWMGQCPACGCWNTLVEQSVKASATKTQTKSRSIGISSIASIGELRFETEARFKTGIGELDRVLGGGAVRGSLILVGGSPGIGKSTLLLQICEYLGKELRILYVSGEESEHQLKMRADRLKVTSKNLFVLSETNLSDITEAVSEAKPDVLIIDSIQTMYNEELNSAPGSVGQVKDCTMALMQIAKGMGITVFVVGHVNKEGAIAGPKVLEHMVDCVLYFEGEEYNSSRILRAAKNRFGSTNEIGVFEMMDTGLAEVPNPSEMLLSGRPSNTPGTCVACVMEGSRPILAEVQALLTPSALNVPRRNSNGVEFNRFMLLLAVLEKRGGLHIGGCDAYVNVIGGLNLNEPAADLAAALSIASSYRDKIIPDDFAAVGEIGLTGELRMVSNLNQRLAEIGRLGFKKCIIPKGNLKNIAIPDGLEVIRAATLIDALRILL